MPGTSDFAVVGAGVVGVAIARQLARTNPGTTVTVFDKEPALARHASGRNSGVLHAGFYYSPDSLKARLTRRGNELLRRFCADHDVPVSATGKVVVATSRDQLPALDALARRAAANDVPVTTIDAAHLHRLEPLARTVDRALWSPTTATADPAGVVRALAADAERRGVALHLGEPVIDAGPGWLRTPRGRYRVGHVINCAGLYADRVASWFGIGGDYALVPFKGVYRYLNWPAGRLRRLVYPVPDPRFPFLGVHLTVTATGRAKIGPTALPVLNREQYRLRDVDVAEIPATAAALARFLRQPGSWRLVATETRSYSPRRLAAAAAALVPAVRVGDLAEWGAPGIRAQLVHRRTGALEQDFVVRGDAHSTHVLNAVSPAWTSSLAVAEHVVAGVGAGG